MQLGPGDKLLEFVGAPVPVADWCNLDIEIVEIEDIGVGAGIIVVAVMQTGLRTVSFS